MGFELSRTKQQVDSDDGAVVAARSSWADSGQLAAGAALSPDHAPGPTRPDPVRPPPAPTAAQADGGAAVAAAGRLEWAQGEGGAASGPSGAGQAVRRPRGSIAVLACGMGGLLLVPVKSASSPPPPFGSLTQHLPSSRLLLIPAESEPPQPPRSSPP